ncbi:MAG: hypothetical protein KDB07_11645, partial [Planctomycetes bacterium]|nr:hypothetical protein [Planctomycetota bacterium]
LNEENVPTPKVTSQHANARLLSSFVAEDQSSPQTTKFVGHLPPGYAASSAPPPIPGANAYLHPSAAASTSTFGPAPKKARSWWFWPTIAFSIVALIVAVLSLLFWDGFAGDSKAALAHAAPKDSVGYVELNDLEAIVEATINDTSFTERGREKVEAYLEGVRSQEPFQWPNYNPLNIEFIARIAPDAVRLAVFDVSGDATSQVPHRLELKRLLGFGDEVVVIEFKDVARATAFLESYQKSLEAQSIKGTWAQTCSRVLQSEQYAVLARTSKNCETVAARLTKGGESLVDDIAFRRASQNYETKGAHFFVRSSKIDEASLKELERMNQRLGKADLPFFYALRHAVSRERAISVSTTHGIEVGATEIRNTKTAAKDEDFVLDHSILRALPEETVMFFAMNLGPNFLKEYHSKEGGRIEENLKRLGTAYHGTEDTAKLLATVGSAARGGFVCGICSFDDGTMFSFKIIGLSDSQKAKARALSYIENQYEGIRIASNRWSNRGLFDVINTEYVGVLVSDDLLIVLERMIPSDSESSLNRRFNIPGLQTAVVSERFLNSLQSGGMTSLPIYDSALTSGFRKDVGALGGVRAEASIAALPKLEALYSPRTRDYFRGPARSDYETLEWEGEKWSILGEAIIASKETDLGAHLNDRFSFDAITLGSGSTTVSRNYGIGFHLALELTERLGLRRSDFSGIGGPPPEPIPTFEPAKVESALRAYFKTLGSRYDFAREAEFLAMLDQESQEALAKSGWQFHHDWNTRKVSFQVKEREGGGFTTVTTMALPDISKD